jgi:hypothetical protein
VKSVMDKNFAGKDDKRVSRDARTPCDSWVPVRVCQPSPHHRRQGAVRCINDSQILLCLEALPVSPCGTSPKRPPSSGG